MCNKYATSVDRMFSPNEISTPFLEVPLRNYRRVMKPRLPRKMTAPARINLNRFWNELEEFYNRYDDRRAKNNNNPIITHPSVPAVQLPAYTTDTFDHEREAAENMLNERLELAPIEDKFSNVGNSACCDCCCCYSPTRYHLRHIDEHRDRIHSCGVESEASNADYQSLSEIDSDTDSDDDLFFAPSYNSQQHYWSSIHSSLPSTPRPPRTLLDLIHRMGLKEY